MRCNTLFLRHDVESGTSVPQLASLQTMTTFRAKVDGTYKSFVPLQPAFHHSFTICQIRMVV